MTIIITIMIRIRNRPGPDRPPPVKRLILADAIRFGILIWPILANHFWPPSWFLPTQFSKPILAKHFLQIQTCLCLPRDRGSLIWLFVWDRSSWSNGETNVEVPDGWLQVIRVRGHVQEVGTDIEHGHRHHFQIQIDGSHVPTLSSRSTSLARRRDRLRRINILLRKFQTPRSGFKLESIGRDGGDR